MKTKNFLNLNCDASVLKNFTLSCLNIAAMRGNMEIFKLCNVFLIGMQRFQLQSAYNNISFIKTKKNNDFFLL